MGTPCTDESHEKRERTKKRSSTGVTYTYTECVTCTQTKFQEWYAKNGEHRRAMSAKWKAENRERDQENSRSWHAANRERDSATRALRMQDPEKYAAMLEKARDTTAARRLDLKEMVLEHYGRACACCGLAVPELLTIDHIVAIGGSASGARRLGHNVYLQLVKSGYPDGYQVLCHSCNLGKYGHRAACPHQSLPILDTATKRWHFQLKTEVMNAYGNGSCICCGESNTHLLTIHHINGDGQQHRIALTGRSRGGAFYSALRRLNWPTDVPLEVRCQSCNIGADLPGGCPCGRNRT